MKLKKLLSLRVNMLLIVLVLMIFAINPQPFAKGVAIKSVGGLAAEQGLEANQIINEINNQKIQTIDDFEDIIKKETYIEPFYVSIKTDKGDFSYKITNDIGFMVNNNLEIISVEEDFPLEKGMKIKEINNIQVGDVTEYNEIINKLIPKFKLFIKTDKEEFAFLSPGRPDITVKNVEKTNIKKGLDLEGGTRVLLKPETEGAVTEKHISDLISVLNNRLNVYGLTDLKIRSAASGDDKFVLIEIAGATREEVKELIAKQGKFEAKIGEENVFTGGANDIPFVCKDDGSCSGIRPPCSRVGEREWYCKFEFVIHLSEKAAKRHAEITKDIPINVTEGGREMLSKTIDFYLDDKLVDSLQIDADLKGKETTQVAISGPGYGGTEAEAYNDALASMDKLQTILITGSLPLKLEIAKLDSISPLLGQSFVKNSLLVGFLALMAVAIVIYIRYRQFKIMLPMIFTSLSEVMIILGFAALVQWNLDLVAIAGIIAAVGTGVDDQIVITDEVLKGTGRFYNWKEKIKRAFFIIMVAYATTFAAMAPLWNAGAGLIRGFALTTIVGITVGVFLTRPAFASIVEKLLKE